ncbi:MAG: sulfite exporter TauE/SafE family protein [Candidatus Binatia bacterium]
MTLLWPQGLLASLVVAFAACVQGSIGFGSALIAAPLLVLIDPALVPGPLIASGLVLTALLSLRERREVDAGGVARLLVGSVAGTVAAAVLLRRLSDAGFSVVFALLVLLAVALSALGIRVRPTTINITLAGLLSGFMGTTSSIGGPPAALMYQHMPGARLRGTLAVYFLVSSSLALVALAWVGRFGAREASFALVLLPGAVGGYLISGYTTGLLDGGYTRPVVLVLSAAAGISLLLRELG